MYIFIRVAVCFKLGHRHYPVCESQYVEISVPRVSRVMGVYLFMLVFSNHQLYKPLFLIYAPYSRAILGWIPKLRLLIFHSRVITNFHVENRCLQMLATRNNQGYFTTTLHVAGDGGMAWLWAFIVYFSHIWGQFLFVTFQRRHFPIQVGHNAAMYYFRSRWI